MEREISRYTIKSNKRIQFIQNGLSFEVIVINTISGDRIFEYPKTTNEIFAAKDYIDAIGIYGELKIIKEGPFTEWIKNNELNLDSLRTYASSKGVKIEDENLFLQPKSEHKIFHNPDIYIEEKDYILGGFTIEEIEGIKVVGDNSDLGETKLDRVFKDRIISHIEDFKKSIEENLKKKGTDTSVYSVSDRINDELNNIFESIDIHLQSNNIDETGVYDNEYLADEIMQHPAYVLWRSRITKRVNDNYSNAMPIPLVSDKPNRISFADAEELTKNITLQHILEQLSNIIENPDEQQQ